MSENIIYCYSGSGHCLHMAEGIAKILGDTDIVMMRRFPAKTDATAARRVGFVFPCYGGGLPGGVEEYVKAVRIAPEAYTFAVEQYAGYVGCGLRKIDDIVGLDYWTAVPNHSTCIWLMPHTLSLAPRDPTKAREMADSRAAQIGMAAECMECRGGNPPRNALFEKESRVFSGLHARHAAKFTVNDRCVGCGTCAKLCPRGNIRLEEGRPVFGGNCIGCLSCLQYCPQAAINMGKITEKRERYPHPEVSAAELNRDVIHID